MEGTSVAAKFEIVNQPIELDELQGSPEEIATRKAREAFKIVGKPVLIEDVSLFFNAYKNLPGPYIKSFSAALGDEGLLKMVEKFDDKTAYA